MKSTVQLINYKDRCATCVYHNGTHWNDGMSEKWCDIHKAATDVRDGCNKHKATSAPTEWTGFPRYYAGEIPEKQTTQGENQ